MAIPSVSRTELSVKGCVSKADQAPDEGTLFEAGRVARGARSVLLQSAAGCAPKPLAQRLLGADRGGENSCAEFHRCKSDSRGAYKVPRGRTSARQTRF